MKQKYVLTAETPTNVIRDVARQLLNRGITWFDLHYQEASYKEKFRKAYSIPSDDLDEVYFAIQSFVRSLACL